MGPHPRRIISLPRAPAAGASAAKASPTTPLPPPAAPVTRAALREPSASLKSPSDAAAKATRRRKLNEAIAWLSETYPSVFGTVKPLALGIGKQIWPQAKAAQIGRRAFDDALKPRACSLSYLDALIADGAGRCGLDGNVVEPVSIEHREHAIAMKAEIVRIKREGAEAREDPRS
jgi:hypothetical protein